MLKIGDIKLPAHRLILIESSAYFKTMLPVSIPYAWDVVKRL